jgi:hypothetical protein
MEYYLLVLFFIIFAGLETYFRKIIILNYNK